MLKLTKVVQFIFNSLNVFPNALYLTGNCWRKMRKRLELQILRFLIMYPFDKPSTSRTAGDQTITSSLTPTSTLSHSTLSSHRSVSSMSLPIPPTRVTSAPAIASPSSVKNSRLRRTASAIPETSRSRSELLRTSAGSSTMTDDGMDWYKATYQHWSRKDL